MQAGQEMDDHELQQAAREALENTTQAEAAHELDVTPATVSLALNHDTPSRYAGTLRRIVEHYTGFSVKTETTTVHRLEEK
jgi:predicted transcriptional regulator